jgi:hypothetical protein
VVQRVGRAVVVDHRRHRMIGPGRRPAAGGGLEEGQQQYPQARGHAQQAEDEERRQRRQEQLDQRAHRPCHALSLLRAQGHFSPNSGRDRTRRAGYRSARKAMAQAAYR